MKLSLFALSAVLAIAMADTTTEAASTVTLTPEAQCANHCE